nr:hypothetical protein [uncultured Flavobacterium sp.]
MKILFTFLGITLCQFMFSQNELQGTFITSSLFSGYNHNEYVLKPEKSNGRYFDVITSKENGTFIFDSNSECGFDFLHTAGRYIIKDANHVRITIDTISHFGFNYEVADKYPKDLGLFHIVRKGSSIRLIKSNGDAIEDKKRLVFSSDIDAIWTEVAQTCYPKDADGRAVTKKDTEKEKVFKAIEGNPSFRLRKIKVLYSKPVDDTLTTILFEHQGKKYMVIHDYFFDMVCLCETVNKPDR